MQLTRTQQIKEAFRRLSDAEPGERDRILEAEAGQDPELWRVATSMLGKTSDVPEDFLEPSADVVEAAEIARARSEHFVELGNPAALDGGSSEQAGTRVGNYVLVRPLGEGGFGEVWEAEQHAPVRRLVALKLIKRGMDTKQILGRFAVERQALAVMDHRCIAKLLDAGSTDDGRPYFAMELVIGQPVVAFCRDRALSTEARLRVFELVCRAIHHAHQRGIVHRDLKPTNILVTESDGEPTPKIIDFGIAKAIDQRDQATAGLTRQRQLVGTPAYMAPEQLSSERGPVDAQSDIYALGALLYELLTGVTPRQAGRSEDPRLDEIVRDLDAPLPASRRASRLANVPVDLDWITLKCLEAEKDRRYDSALELAEDVHRFLDESPVLAGPPDPIYRIRKFCRRHRNLVGAAAALTAVVFLLGTAGFFWTSWKNRQLDASNDELRALNAEYLLEKSAAERALDDVERLSDAHLLTSLTQRADEDLWPAVPEKIPALERWLADAEELAGRVEGHRAELDALRGRALPPGEVGVAPLRRSGPVEFDYPRFEADVLAALARPDADEASRARQPEPLAFASTKDAWLHWLLEDLVARLDAFHDEKSGTVTSVRRRLAFASEIQERSVTAHAAAWQTASDAIRSGSIYPGLRATGLPPQIGLVPLGPDPDSGLQEFLDLATHDGPLLARDAQGRLELTDDFGVVLVLIPGGTFLMGAQGQDPTAPNYDPFAGSTEGPVHERHVDAYLLSKFEMTQAQWVRLENGANPSFTYAGVKVGDERITRRNPVEQVQWGDGLRVLRKAGMTYPSEAQWEYATRAGTTTPFFFGLDGPEIGQYANFADVHAKQVTMRISNHEDGYAYSAPVGSLAANPYGLHDVYGNVAEWCLDRFYPHYDAKQPLEEPLALGSREETRRRVTRGGAFNLTPLHSRSARRHAVRGDSILGSVGVRPARAVR